MIGERVRGEGQNSAVTFVAWVVGLWGRGEDGGVRGQMECPSCNRLRQSKVSVKLSVTHTVELADPVPLVAKS